MTVEVNQNSIQGGSERVALERRFEDIGWGVLLLAIGTIMASPREACPAWQLVNRCRAHSPRTQRGPLLQRHKLSTA